MKTIEIDGVLYNLTPANETRPVNEVQITNTFYYGACSDDGKFEFCVLLNDENKIWEDTQSITYLPNTDKQEIWDNVDYLKDILSGKNKNPYGELSDSEFEILTNLLKEVRKKGWI